MEKKRNIFQKIADFFVKLFLAIISLFKKEKKDEKKELETFEDNIQNNVINLRDSNNIPLPDTQSTKNFPDYLSSTSDSTDNRDKTLKMYKDFVKDKDLNIYQKLYLIFDEDHIKEIIEDILKEDYEIDAKKTKQVIKDNIEKLEEKLLEDVKYKIEHKDIETEEVLKDYLKEEIKKEVKEHPLDKVEPPKKYVMATNKPEKKIQPKEEKLPKVTQEKIIKDIPKRIKPRVIEKAKETKIAMIKTKEPAIVKPKDHLFVAASAATVMAAGVAVDLVTPLKKNDLPKTKIIPNKKVELPKEIKKDEPSIQKEETKIELKPLEKDLETKQTINTPPPVKEEVKVETKEEETQELILEKNIKEEKQKTHEVIETKIKEFEYVDDHKDEIKENEIAQINKERLVKEDKKITEELKQIEKEIEVLKEEKAKEEKEEIKEQPKEEIKKEEPKKEEPKKDEPKKEEPKKEEEKKEEKKEPEKAPDFALTDKIASTIENSKVEMKSDKEFEDKSYDQYESQINELLYDIELYKIKYDKTLSKEQKKKLKEEERKLRTAKSNIQFQKSIDIEKERKALEEEISSEEIQGLQLELQKKHLENKKDLNDELIDKVEDLEFLADDKVHYLEKKLIKKKLRKALIVTQMSSILALPFIRNKYFFYFTAGLIARTELMFLGDLFKRKTSEYEPVELTALKNGRDALNGALDITRDNIIYLDSLEKTTLAKYPELSSDSEYIQYIISLRNTLAKNQNKLARKRDAIDKFISKTESKAKKLEQKLDNAA